MRPAKELLKLVQKEFKEQALIVEYSYGDDITNGYNGLCYVFAILDRAGIIKTDERYYLRDIIKAYGKTRDTFYTYEGKKTDSPHNFIWRVEDKDSRLEWLIKELKKD